MIEKVGYSKPVSAARAAATRQATAAGSTEFAEALARAEAAGETASAAPVVATGGALGLLGAQEISAEEHNRRKAVRRGRLTLEALSNLRDALLMGALPLSTLRQLEQMVAEERASVPDPVLSGILDEIELRAAVEMAKLEMSGLLK